jgi:hypothetical protein
MDKIIPTPRSLMSQTFKSRKTWREKLERVQEPKVIQVRPRMQKRFGTGTMLIPRPLDVDSLIRKIPRGRLATQSQIRARLAKDCGADVTCPITTGIFVRIAAEAANEDMESGKKRVTPYWRVVRDDGSLNKKFPGGIRAQSLLLKKEGHKIASRKGKKSPIVSDHEKYLTSL